MLALFVKINMFFLIITMCMYYETDDDDDNNNNSINDKVKKSLTYKLTWAI